MYSHNNKQYIFKLFSGKIRRLFFDSTAGICYSILTKRNTWTEPVSVVKKAYHHFYVAMDSDEYLHLVYQDLHGNIFYSKLNGTPIISLPVLNSKSPSPYNKHLFLLPRKDKVHFLYTLHYNNNVILTYQVLANGIAEKPSAIDYVSNCNIPYTAISDKSGNLYVFYRPCGSRNSGLGYRILTLSRQAENNGWSDFVPLTGPAGNEPAVSDIHNYDFISAIVDASNTIHICYQKQSADSKNYELIYRNKPSNSDMWSDETVIHSSVYPFENSSILAVDSTLIIYWVRNNIIYYSGLINKSNIWRKAARYNFAAGKQLFCFSYNTNIPYEQNRIAIREIPGVFSNGLRLAFYHEFSGNGHDITDDNFKDMFVNSYKTLKSYVDNLLEANGILKNQVRELMYRYDSMSRQYEKLKIEIQLLENELRQLKNDFNLATTSIMKTQEKPDYRITGNISYKTGQENVGSFNKPVAKKVRLIRYLAPKKYSKK